VTLVNTPPPDMTVALLAKGIDAFSGWDPWPIVAQKDVPGAYLVVRGGDLISYLGYNVATRAWVEKNGETIEKFLAAVAEADKWMRANPKQAAQVATRWIPGLKADVAEAAMQFNIQQNDRRLSANNYRALWAAQDRLSRLGVIKSTFDVNKHIEPKYILNVMKNKPELFSDLPAIPADVALKPGYVFKP
jgi:ABC-type nitrate/sulfonate/bicarbonate transport system substrate-binding protein